MDFFENHGVALKTERGNRVFPQSDKAADIIDALFLWVQKGGCDHRTYDRRRAARSRTACSQAFVPVTQTYKAASHAIVCDRRRVLSADRLDR